MKFFINPNATKFNESIKNLSRFIPYPNIGKTESFAEWKNRLLFFLLVAMVVLGTVAYLPSVVLSIKEKLWSVAVLDSLVYIAVLFTAFSKRLSAKLKIISIIIIFYILGVALLLFLGKNGAGFNWLFMSPVLISFFYGKKGALRATLLNIGILALLTLPVYFNINQFGFIGQYGIDGWIINSINFIIICSLISFGLAIIISNIDSSLQKEKELSLLLKDNKDKLVTEKNRAEESDRLKSTFLANMSHEIRTPMNSILGFSGLLTEPGLSQEKAQQYNHLIQVAGEQLIHIIDDIIDISKIELNQMKINLGPVKIYNCLKEIADAQQNKIKSQKKDLTLELNVAEKYHNIIIESDETRFRQIVNNLVGNAIEYTESGLVIFGFTIPSSKNEELIEFFVKDTGRGIPQEAQKKIFDRFTQAGDLEFKKGTGLGLSITKGLLDLLGGTIRLQSEPNIGSEFYFTLPYVKTVD